MDAGRYGVENCKVDRKCSPVIRAAWQRERRWTPTRTLGGQENDKLFLLPGLMPGTGYVAPVVTRWNSVGHTPPFLILSVYDVMNISCRFTASPGHERRCSGKLPWLCVLRRDAIRNERSRGTGVFSTDHANALPLYRVIAWWRDRRHIHKSLAWEGHQRPGHRLPGRNLKSFPEGRPGPHSLRTIRPCNADRVMVGDLTRSAAKVAEDMRRTRSEDPTIS